MSDEITDAIDSFGYLPGDIVWVENNGLRIVLAIEQVDVNEMILSDNETYVYDIPSNRWISNGVEYVIGQGDEDDENNEGD